MGISGAGVDTDALKSLIEAAKASGGSEIANTQPFIERFCSALGLERPAFSHEQNVKNDYVFERRITFKHPDGTTSNGRIDLYKRGCFVLESKQSSMALGRVSQNQLSLLPEDAKQLKLGTARRGTGGWDRAMLAARNQAESYARALPVEHGYPPFLIVLDVGNVIEVYADFSGQGKNYAHFPDRQTYRLAMDDLLVPDVQDRLRAIWDDPLTLDPAKRSAEVTRDIAGRLSIIAKRLETKHDPKDVAEFLMRCLFTMFAEDVGLLPGAGFADLLKELSSKPETFPVALESLWKTMDEGGYEPRMMATLKRFNGSLFKSRRALPLAAEDIHELYVAATQDWSDVEPAIFGTLLERALNPIERGKLGAHYTPRAYVERLVVPTIIEPLRADWDEVQTHVADLTSRGRDTEALNAVRGFHRKLCTTRVLDPACGSGNFLYVSFELMKKLEGEVLETIIDLGGVADRYADFPDEAGRDRVGRKLARSGGRFSVDPHQFYGIELNPRAVPIADLVLWIGYLKWQLRTVPISELQEPVLDAYGTIKHQDAILAFDRVELLRDETGAPVTRWDGVGVKLHPVADRLIPDPDKRTEVHLYVNPRPAEWPEADYIVGNPPFIGNKRMISALGEEYVEAVRSVHPQLPSTIDFVMYWWAKAARLVAEGSVRRFGFITTNSITQIFNRQTVELALRDRISIVFAVADHPWVDASDGANVRISMTVAQASSVRMEGRVGVLSDDELLEERVGAINSQLGIGPNVADALGLRQNSNLSFQGVKLVGAGFQIEPSERDSLLREYPDLVNRLPSFWTGRDLTKWRRPRHVIDAFGLSQLELLDRYPKVYQRLLELVKPERDQVRRAGHRERWWLFGEPRPHMRAALESLERYLTTSEVSKHRYFQFLASSFDLVDGSIVAIALPQSWVLSVVSSRVHIYWALSAGGRLEDRPRYQNDRAFDPFPFPPFLEQQSNMIAVLDALGERLDSFRKERLATHDFLTMTLLYNVLERLRELESGAEVEPLNDKEHIIYEAGLVSVLKEIHDDIDRVVFEAYGWADLIPALVGKPGATTPSPHKTPEQEAAEEELLTRLVALNKERAEEEARGIVRWLRPEYQIPRLGKKVAAPEGEQLDVDVTVVAKDQRPKWPGDAFEQIKIVREVLARAPAPMPVEGIATSFDGRLTDKRRERVRQVLDTLVATGAARMPEGTELYFVPR